MRRRRRAQVKNIDLNFLWTYSLAIAIQHVFRFLGNFDYEGEILKKKKNAFFEFSNFQN